MMKKISISLLFIIIIVLTLGGIFIAIQLYHLKPDYSGKFGVEELRASTTLSWDDHGVIHISGEHTSDVILAMGYAAAYERLWQMEMTRRVAKGELSEIFGDTTLKIDRFFLTLGLDSITRQVYQNISPESRQWLQAYAAGINAYLRDARNNLPVEFVFLNFKPAYWSAEDCLLQNRLMAWYLNFNWKADLLYWQLSAGLTDTLFQEIWPQWGKAPTIISSNGLPKISSEIHSIHRQLGNILKFDLAAWGSNSWVVSPFRSASGAAMLANDPHLGLQIPSLWMEFRLKSPELDVAGFSLPGSPGIIIGRNQNIAWGLTNGMVDDCDYFIEKVDTLAGVYWQGDQKLPLNIRSVSIKSSGKLRHTFTVFSTSRGPVMNHLFPEWELVDPISLRWVGWEVSDELNTFIQLARCVDWPGFEEALRGYTLPAQNFIYADRQGNIGYRLGGKVPIRSYPNGLMVQAGFDSQFSWKSWIPFNQMPRLFNPVEGFIITANHKIDDRYPYYLSEFWEPPYRAQRIRELLTGEARITPNMMQRFQMDDLNLIARQLLPDILIELNRLEEQTPLEEEAIQLLKYWDFHMGIQSVAASIFESMQHALIYNIFQDEMGDELFKLFTDIPNFFLRIYVQVMQKEHSRWFDNILTPEIENRSVIVQRSFREALLTLGKNFGASPEEWGWGKLHQLTLRHSLGQVRVTELVFNRGPFPLSGNGTTVNVASYRYADPFQVLIGPSLRFQVDWGNPQVYFSIIPGGNSGNFLSQYYDKQIAMWRNGELKPVLLSKFFSRRSVELIPMGKRQSF